MIVYEGQAMELFNRQVIQRSRRRSLSTLSHPYSLSIYLARSVVQANCCFVSLLSFTVKEGYVIELQGIDSLNTVSQGVTVQVLLLSSFSS